MMADDELFPADEVAMDSPKLAWIKKYGVETQFNQTFDDADWLPWSAAFGDPVEVIEKHGDDAIGFGHSEAEAIVDLAVKWKIPLWNEEGAGRLYPKT